MPYGAGYGTRPGAAVHLLTYLGAALAFGHQLSGPDIVGSARRWVWAMLHTSVAVLLLWYRLWCPYGRRLRHAPAGRGGAPERPGSSPS